MSGSYPSTQWWITEGGFLDRGGRKKLGPFVSQDLAMSVRTFIEKAENHNSLYISEEPGCWVWTPTRGDR